MAEQQAERRQRPIQIGPEAANGLAVIVDDNIRQAETDRAGYASMIEANRELYAPEQPRLQKPWDNACELVIPVLKISQNALVSRTHAALLQKAPVWEAEYPDKGRARLAQGVERFLERQQLEQMRLEAMLDPGWQAQFSDGVAVFLGRWREDRGRRTSWKRRPLTDEMGQPVLVSGPDGGLMMVSEREPQVLTDAVLYDGPDWQWIDILNAGTFPAANGNFQTSTGAYAKYSLTGAALLVGVQRGLYDREAVERLRGWAGDTDTLNTADESARGIEGFNVLADPRFLATPYTITEVYVLFSESDNAPPQDWCVVLHQETTTVLSCQPMPWWCGRRPLVALRPFAWRTGIGGDSLGDIAADFQAAQTQLLRLSIDAMEIGIAPERLVDAGLKGEALRAIQKRRGPNGLVPIPNLAETAAKLMQAPNGYHPNTALPLINLLHQYGQLVMGIPDTQLGVPESKQVTAYQTQRMMEESQSNLGMVLQRQSRALDDIGAFTLAMDYQHQDRESVQRLWAEANPEMVAEGVTLEEALEDYEALTLHSAGSSASSNRALQSERAREKFMVLTSNPVALELVTSDPARRYAVVADLLSEGYSDENVERSIGTEQQAVERAQMEEQLALAQAEQEQQAAAEGAMMQAAGLGAGPAGRGPM